MFLDSCGAHSGVPLMASCNHLPPRHLSCKLPDVSNITLICQRFRSALYSHAQRVQTVMLLLSFETTSVGDGLTRIWEAKLAAGRFGFPPGVPVMGWVNESLMSPWWVNESSNGIYSTIVRVLSSGPILSLQWCGPGRSRPFRQRSSGCRTWGVPMGSYFPRPARRQKTHSLSKLSVQAILIVFDLN